MAWIEFHQSLGGHIKLRRLSAELGVPKPQAVGHLAYLWWWALDGCPGGSLEGIPDAVIADVCCWQGNPTTFADALRSCGWVDPDGKIHDWEVYIGCLLDKRDRDRKRKMELRATSRGRPEDVQRMSSGHPSDIRATAQVTTNQPTNQPTTTEKGIGNSGTLVADAPGIATSNASSMLQASPKHADQKPPTPTHSHSSANLEPEPVPTVNHPTLAQCIDHFLACSDYCEAEIKRAFNGFEVVKDPAGNWIWGQAQAGRPARLVTDWRIALEQRMADYRMNNPDSPITRSPITALSRECKRIMKELGK